MESKNTALAASAAVTGAAVTKDGDLIVTIQDDTGAQTPVFAGKIDVSEVVEEELQNYAPISAAIRPTVVGNPAVCEDSVAWRLQGLKIYGKSTQDGEPSPENPVPIVSAGDGGSLSVDLLSNQLLNCLLFDGTSQKGITARADDLGRIILNGTATSNSFIEVDFFAGVGEKIKVKAYNPVGNENVAIKCAAKDFSDATNIVILRDPNTSSELQFNKDSEKLIIRTIAGTTLTNFIIRPMFYKYGDGTWEPYKSQNLTITTPNGLPGIPVDSGGNFTDADGQQLGCDVKDYCTGKYVQKCAKVTFDGSNRNVNLSTSSLSNTVRYNIALNSNEIATSSPVNSFCNILNFELNYSTDSPHFYVQDGFAWIFMPKSIAPDVESLKSFAKTNPITFIYPLKTPIETDIPAEELAAYRALTTYDGTTVISTAEPVAGIEARYILDGTAAWNDIQAIKQAVASLQNQPEPYQSKDE